MRYLIPSIYRGIQIHKIVFAKSDAEAARLLDVSIHNIRTYASKKDTPKEFEGIYAYMDSGRIVFEEGRKDLHSKKIPFEEMKAIIDESTTLYYSKKAMAEREMNGEN